MVAAAISSAATPEVGTPASGDDCLALAAEPWPGSSLAQAAQLRRLEAASVRCNAQPRFLAALGGAWLEVGDAKQALAWLERALLLDPTLEAALADHALALAALGEPVALQELLVQWAGRSDVPPALWYRLKASAHQGQPLNKSNGVAALARSLLVASAGWQQRGDLQLLAGYESNLAQSPSLDELRITPAEGPITLPLAEPLKAVSGNATLYDASWQAATSNALQQSFLLGVQVLGRHAPRHSDTDWHSLRLALSASQRIGQWRWRLQARWHDNDGRLNQPSRQSKWSLAAEGPLGSCSQRWSIEADRLRYRLLSLNDASSTALVSSALCPLPLAGGWAVGFSLRGADEHARDELRPGGDQSHSAVALRLLGDVAGSGSGRAWTLDAQWNYGRTTDERGYSPLLESNVQRKTRTRILNVELTGPAPAMPHFDARTVLQMQLSRQDSNLALFSFSAATFYAGLRLSW